MNQGCILSIVMTACMLAGCTASDSLTRGRWVDLTHSYDDQTVYWPTAQGFELESEFDDVTDRGYYYHANRYAASEHGGTHVDAPIHFCRTGRTLEEIPVEQLMGPAVVVDVSAKAAADRDYQVGVADLQNWEATHGRIPDDCILLLRTGFAARWPDLKEYLGTARKGPEAVADLHFPGLHPGAAGWLVSPTSTGCLPKARGWLLSP